VLLKIRANGQQELNYEAIEAMTSADFVQKIKETLRKRTKIFKIDTMEINNYLAFRLVAGTRVPSYFIELTYNRSNGYFFVDLDVLLCDVYKVADFISDIKQIAAEQGDYESMPSIKASPSIVPLSRDSDKAEEG
jgi:hypothetical protein